MTGFIAQELVPSGESFAVKNIVDAGPWAAPQIPQDWSLRVNRFWIDYTPNGGIDQFYSDLSVLDKQGQEVKRKTIFVNEPLRYKGVTLYQTDWGVSSVRIRVNKSPVLQLPMAKLNTNGQGRIWGTWIPTKTDMSEGVSLLTRDLQGMLLLYDVKGQLISTLRPGMSTQVNGVTLYIDELVGSTGLQIKADPSIPVVYTGFVLLMLGVVMSYVSHSQIWALQQDGHFYVGGKTNRAQVGFEQEMLDILAQLTAQKQVEDSELKAALASKS